MSDNPKEPLHPTPREINRLTVVMSISHEHGGEQPVTIPISWSTLLELDEDSYSRRHEATEQWKPIDLGYIGEDAHLIIVHNLAGRHLVNPTEEEKQLNKGRVLEVATADEVHCRLSPLVIPAGTAFPILLDDPLSAVIRCRNDKAKYRIYVIPG